MMTDYGFHPVWVAPFPGELMGANFLHQPVLERAACATTLREVLNIIDDRTLRKMLQDLNWRPRLVAAWFIGFKRAHQFVEPVGEELLHRPDYASQCCFVLARLGGAPATS